MTLTEKKDVVTTASIRTGLRTFRVDDVEPLYMWYLHNPGMLQADRLFPKQWLYDVQKDEGQFRYAITASGTLCGLATLWWAKMRVPHPMILHAGVLCPTILIDPAQRGRGHASDALDQLLMLAHICARAQEVRATVYADNVASLALARRAFGEPWQRSTTASGREQVIFRLARPWR